MDRRYLLCILIIIICCINLYIIAENSNTVGSASVTFDKYKFTLPPDYEVTELYAHSVQIHGKDLRYITVESKNPTYTYNYTAIANQLKNKPNHTILSSGTINIHGISVDSIFYQTVDENNFVNNRSNFYFKKDNDVFQVGISGFDYDTEMNQTIDILTYIVDSICRNPQK